MCPISLAESRAWPGAAATDEMELAASVRAIVMRLNFMVGVWFDERI